MPSHRRSDISDDWSGEKDRTVQPERAPIPGGRVVSTPIYLPPAAMVLYASYKGGVQVRYSNEHKAETRRRVLKEAAQEIRAKGPDGVAVAGVMARAGLTHGGFYAHFESKEAMIADAIGTMFDDARGRSDAIEQTDDPRAALRAYVDFYLSPAHRDRRERGCPLPTLSGDLARSGEQQRER